MHTNHWQHNFVSLRHWFKCGRHFWYAWNLGEKGWGKYEKKFVKKLKKRHCWVRASQRFHEENQEGGIGGKQRLQNKRYAQVNETKKKSVQAEILLRNKKYAKRKHSENKNRMHHHY